MINFNGSHNEIPKITTTPIGDGNCNESSKLLNNVVGRTNELIDGYNSGLNKGMTYANWIDFLCLRLKESVQLGINQFKVMENNNKRYNKIEHKLDRLENKFKRFENRLDKLENKNADTFVKS